MENPILNRAIRNVFVNRNDIFNNDQYVLKYFETEDNAFKSDGYNSSLVFGRIVYTDKHKKTVYKSIPVLVKVMPEIRNSKFLSFSFVNEIHFYSKILPHFGSLQNSVYDLFPKFFSGELMYGKDTDDGAIVMEDLRTCGFRMADKKAYLDHNHLSVMMRKLGEFHAYSFEAKRQAPNLFYPLAMSFLETNFAVTKEIPNFLKEVGERGLQWLIDDPIYAHKVPVIKDMLRDADSFVKTVLTEDKESPTAVLCHGDFLRNNVMFRYDDEDGTPRDMKFIDMASCRLASPVVDLATVLYLNADQKTRTQHWHSLIDEYYTALESTFPDNPLVPKKEQILSEFRVKSFYGYLVAAYFLPFLLADDNKLSDPADQIPDELQNCGFYEIPLDLLVNLNLIKGGPPGTESLVNILKDLINRGYI